MKTRTCLAADIGLCCSLCFLFLLYPFPSPHPTPPDPHFFLQFLFTLSNMAFLVASPIRKLFRKVSLCICTR
uniref:Uncharacterized protein n=1 Tax=Sciurus vulgaris TaxID=55149 RepID=A0A8D2CUN2_SCIVU